MHILTQLYICQQAAAAQYCSFSSVVDDCLAVFLHFFVLFRLFKIGRKKLSRF